MIRIGIDIGGTKIEGIVLGESGELLGKKRVPTPRDDYRGTLDAVGELVSELEREAGESCRVGIGMPGAISPATGLVKNSNSTWLNGTALAREMEQRLGRELRFANDADCFALSEATDGAGKGASPVFGVILGTGVGGGVVVDGRLLRGPNAIAGEWGHNPLPWMNESEWPGRECYCGRRGCIETFLSGPGMVADHRSVTGEKLESHGIVERATAGDEAAEAALQRYEDRLARALAGVINILDPETIVLGGGLSNVSRLYDRVPPLWSGRVFSDRVDTRLLPPRHGDAGGARGAAWLW